MSSKRSLLLYLLEIYELLMNEPRTFYYLRNQIGIGFEPLKKLLELFEADGLIEKIETENKIVYCATKEMYKLFSGTFFDGISKFQNRK